MLKFDRYSENLIEISQAYLVCLAKYHHLADIDSMVWKIQFVNWANEFEAKYPDEYWWDKKHDYSQYIEEYAIGKILDFGGSLFGAFCTEEEVEKMKEEGNWYEGEPAEVVE